MAKKELKKQTIEEILAENTPISDAVKSAVQRYYEEKKKQEQIIIDTLDCIIWDLVDNLSKIRAEEKRAQQCIVDVAAAKDAYLADPDLEVLAQGLRKAGINLSRYIE